MSRAPETEAPSAPHEDLGHLVALIGNAKVKRARRNRPTNYVAVGPATYAQLVGARGDRIHGLTVLSSERLQETQFALLAKREEIEKPEPVEAAP